MALIWDQFRESTGRRLSLAWHRNDIAQSFRPHKPESILRSVLPLLQGFSKPVVMVLPQGSPYVDGFDAFFGMTASCYLCAASAPPLVMCLTLWDPSFCICGFSRPFLFQGKSDAVHRSASHVLMLICACYSKGSITGMSRLKKLLRSAAFSVAGTYQSHHEGG